MDTQNTPIHIHLWNRDFWHLALANTLISMAVYMQLVIVFQMLSQKGMSGSQIGGVIGAYGIGLLLLGGCCSYLVQRFRRNKVAIVAMAVLAAGMAMLAAFPQTMMRDGWLLWLRLATGAFFGLAQMVLVSTLIIDTCEATQRTEANYAASWFGRFAVSLGPLAALVVGRTAGMAMAAWVAVGLAVFAILLVMMVDFPFRTPEDNVRVLSLDRFLLPQAWGLFVNLLMVTTVMGMIMAGEIDSPKFFAALMAGFLLALTAEKFVFVNAELMSETVAGLLLLAFAILLKMMDLELTPYSSPVLVGLGVGLVGSRFLLFFIKMSQHSKRGTSQSTFFVAWEMGMAAGWWLGFGNVPEWFLAAGCGGSHRQAVLAMALVLTMLALLVYVVFTHKWYVKHKNR